MRIVRFLDYDSARSVLAEESTFCLRSLQYYQSLEERNRDTTYGDKQESKAKFEDTGKHYEWLGGALVSCWCILGHSQPYSSKLDILQNYTRGIALIATVDSVAAFLQEETSYLLGGWYFYHDKVKYYLEEKEPKNYRIDEAMFWKRKNYCRQHEYRFAFVSSSQRAHLQTLIFYTRNPMSYIDEIHFGPELKQPQIKILVTGAIEADLANKIHNFDNAIYRMKNLTQ